MWRANPARLAETHPARKLKGEESIYGNVGGFGSPSVFGSSIGDAEHIGDIDVAVESFAERRRSKTYAGRATARWSSMPLPLATLECFNQRGAPRASC